MTWGDSKARLLISMTIILLKLSLGLMEEMSSEWVSVKFLRGWMSSEDGCPQRRRMTSERISALRKVGCPQWGGCSLGRQGFSVRWVSSGMTGVLSEVGILRNDRCPQ